ncbi:hypothetical protein [Tateyamaria sp. SN6-1]|uniref:hypothetical protein n=1 Tax=Tateyamaria sp. SN6-1 TaxID=3092148 RepID=UPI0039F4698A
MSGTQKSFAERIAQIEKTKAPAQDLSDITTTRKSFPKPPAGGGQAVSGMVNLLAAAVLIPTVLGMVLLFGGEGVRGAFASVFVSDFGEVKTADASADTRYEWDTKVTPFNAARLGMKRMNAFAQDEAEWEMQALIRRANDLGQPFLAKEIKREMAACGTLKCRAQLQSDYEAKLAQLRRATPNW